MHNVPDRLLACIHNQVRLGRVLVRVVNTRKSLDLTSARTLVHTLLICLLAVLEWGGYVDQVERTKLGHSLLCLGPGDAEWGDGSADNGGTGAGELSSDERDTLDVGVAILAGETEFGGKLGADGFA